MHSTLVQVVGYDGSPLSELGLRRAVEDAACAEVAVVHVVAVAAAEGPGTKVRMPDGLLVDPWAGLSALRLMVGELLRTWQLSDHLVRVVAHVATGEPGPTLVDIATRLEAHSITVGLRGTARSFEGKLGRVASHVVRTAPCKVQLQTLLSPREGSRQGDPLRLYLVLGDGFTTPGAPPTRMARA